MADFGRLLPTGATGAPLRSSQASLALARRLSRVEARNVTFLDGSPPFWTDAAGANVRDEDGNVYLDFTGAFGVALAGHRHPLVCDRVDRQAGRLVHGMGDVHPSAIKVEFLEALSALLPWSDPLTILGLSGSGAVEAALKTAHLATGRAGVIAFEGSYHGLTLGALACTHRQHFRHPFTDRLTDHVDFVPFPATTREAANSLAAVARALEHRAMSAGAVGAVIAEPIQGRAGVRVPPGGFLRELAKLAHEAGALVISDEIFTGMGRTGSLLAWAQGDAWDDRVGTPDLVCLGKALGGGMPLSACCGPAAVLDAWPPSGGEAIHTGTFLGHPVSCAAGLGFLEALAAEDLAGRSARLGEQAMGYLTAALEGCEQVVAVRGQGLMLGIELRPKQETLTQASEGTESEGTATAVVARALKRGLIVLPAGDRGRSWN